MAKKKKTKEEKDNDNDDWKYKPILKTDTKTGYDGNKIEQDFINELKETEESS